jgi:hypothetical protein
MCFSITVTPRPLRDGTIVTTSAPMTDLWGIRVSRSRDSDGTVMSSRTTSEEAPDERACI